MDKTRLFLPNDVQNSNKLFKVKFLIYTSFYIDTLLHSKKRIYLKNNNIVMQMWRGKVGEIKYTHNCIYGNVICDFYVGAQSFRFSITWTKYIFLIDNLFKIVKKIFYFLQEMCYRKQRTKIIYYSSYHIETRKKIYIFLEK